MSTQLEKFMNSTEAFEILFVGILFGIGFTTGSIAAITILLKLTKLFS